MVEERSIADVRPDDLSKGFPNAISSPESASGPTRSGSRDGQTTVKFGQDPGPRQPFSVLKGEAFDDERHLWPKWFPLIEARRPVVCFGEQVASIDGLCLASTLCKLDLDRADYTCGAADPCAAGVGAPIGDSVYIGWPTPAVVGYDGRLPSEASGRTCESERLRDAGRMADEPRGGCGIERDASRSAELQTRLTAVAALTAWATSAGARLQAERRGRSRNTGQERATAERPGSSGGMENAMRSERGEDPGNAEDLGKHRDGTKAQIGLENEAKLSGWTTPQAHDTTGRSLNQKEIHGTMHGAL